MAAPKPGSCFKSSLGSTLHCSYDQQGFALQLQGTHFGTHRLLNAGFSAGQWPRDSLLLFHVDPLPVALQLHGLLPLPGHLFAALVEDNGKMPTDRFRINLSWLCTPLVHCTLELLLCLKLSEFCISTMPATRVGAGASPCQLSVTSTLAPNRCRMSLSLFFLVPAYLALLRPILGKEKLPVVKLKKNAKFFFIYI